MIMLILVDMFVFTISLSRLIKQAAPDFLLRDPPSLKLTIRLCRKKYLLKSEWKKRAQASMIIISAFTFTRKLLEKD